MSKATAPTAISGHNGATTIKLIFVQHERTECIQAFLASANVLLFGVSQNLIALRYNLAHSLQRDMRILFLHC
jgi:hypothetical protein